MGLLSESVHKIDSIESKKIQTVEEKLHICLPESINMKKVYGVCKADICSSAGAEEQE